MPYLPDEGKQAEHICYATLVRPRTGAELNWAVTVLIQNFLEEKKEARYADLEDVTGAVTGALEEFNRNVKWKYEDYKRGENGNAHTLY